jgi:copper transport protein
MVVTGVYLASGVVGSVDAALRTFYGRTLLLKVGVAGLAALLGLINANRLRKHGHRDLRRTLIGEAVAVLTILALAAVLTSGQPAREPQLVRAPQVSTLPVVDGAVGDLQESLAVRPNVPGRNVVLIDVFNTRRPALAPIRQVDVMLVGLDGKPGEPLVAELISDGKWSVNADLPVSGHTRIIVNVHRPGLPDAEHSYAWTVGGAPAVVHTALVSNAPIGKLLTTVSAVLGFAAVAGWAGVLVWRRKQRLDAATGAGQSTEQDADPPMASSSV